MDVVFSKYVNLYQAFVLQDFFSVRDIKSRCDRRSQTFCAGSISRSFIETIENMAVDRRDANMKKLKEADKIQDKTKEAIWRIQRQAAEAEELGAQTLDELRRQGQQMVRALPSHCSL
jgi:hypothetical protein